MNITQLADSIVLAFMTHSIPKGVMAGTRPVNKESIMETSGVVIWAFKNK